MTGSIRAATLLRYGSALLFLIAALWLRAVLDPWLGERQQLSLLFGAVALTVWYAGALPAGVATVLGYFASDYLFIEPRGVFAVAEPHQFISLVTYLASCAIIIAFGEGLRAGKQRAKRYARELEEKQSQLEAQERRKDDFLATLAHELRNPLATLRNAARFLERHAPASADMGVATGTIGRQVDYMVRLVDDLLDLSRIKSGRLHVEKATVDLRDVLSRAIDAVQPEVEARRHELIVSLPEVPIPITGDLTRLTQVFVNILGNATKYTPPAGHIRLTATVRASVATVTVQDDGIGIAEGMLPRVFDMYEQIDRPPQHTHGGLGIGLALVRQIVELHGGRIEVHSEGEDRGAQFIVRLSTGSATSGEPDHLQPGHRDLADKGPPEHRPHSMRSTLH
jgi:signal transduction histidine kinase